MNDEKMIEELENEYLYEEYLEMQEDRAEEQAEMYEQMIWGF